MEIIDYSRPYQPPQATPNMSAGSMWDSMQQWYQNNKGDLWGQKNKDGSTTMGLLPTGFTIASGLMDSWAAMQQLDLARDQFNFQKDAFNMNWENQRKLTNSRLEDRQRARLGANPNGYESLGSYMNRNGV